MWRILYFSLIISNLQAGNSPSNHILSTAEKIKVQHVYPPHTLITIPTLKQLTFEHIDQNIDHNKIMQKKVDQLQTDLHSELLQYLISKHDFFTSLSEISKKLNKRHNTLPIKNSIVLYIPPLMSIAIGKSNGTIELWQAKPNARFEQKKVFHHSDNMSPVTALCYNIQKNAILSGHDNGTVSVCFIDPNSSRKPFWSIKHTKKVSSITTNNVENYAATASYDNNIKIWIVDNAENIYTITRQEIPEQLIWTSYEDIFVLDAQVVDKLTIGNATIDKKTIATCSSTPLYDTKILAINNTYILVVRNSINIIKYNQSSANLAKQIDMGCKITDLKVFDNLVFIELNYHQTKLTELTENFLEKYHQINSSLVETLSLYDLDQTSKFYFNFKHLALLFSLPEIIQLRKNTHHKSIDFFK